MAERPVFVPRPKGPKLVDEIKVQFDWNRGMAPSQKRKNIAALHEAARARNLAPLLEISSKSTEEFGRRLSAFALVVSIGGMRTTVESAYQGSKFFSDGGPFPDLYDAGSREARGDPRLQTSGKLLGFRLDGKDYPLTPATAFYDWLYLNAMCRAGEWHGVLNAYAGFTDIEFNPDRSLNCQARSCATFLALEKRDQLDEAVESFESFAGLLMDAGGI